MARGVTPLLSLGVWDSGDNPGAGSQTVDSDGLNANWIDIDTALGTEHNNAGAHGANVIKIANLNTDVVDGATLEHNVGGLRINDLGITSAKYGAGSVDTAALKQTGGSEAVTSATIRDGAVITVALGTDAVTNAKVVDDAITAAKQSHDNNARKLYLYGAIKTTTNYLRTSDVADTHSFRQLRAGAVTGLGVVQGSDDASSGATQTYASAVSTVTGKFAAGDKLGCFRNTSTGVVNVTINGTQVSSFGPPTDQGSYATDDLFITIETELDD